MPEEWREQLANREELSTFPPFANAARLASSWDGVTTDDGALDRLRSEITRLGQAVVDDQNDVDNVFAAIRASRASLE